MRYYFSDVISFSDDIRVFERRKNKLTFKHDIVDLGRYDLRRIDSPNGRRYSIDGHSYPSITTVLGILSEEAIAAWRARIGEEEADRISRQAGRRGTAVHACIESFIGGFEPKPANPIIEIMFKKISYILEDRLSVVHGIERAMFSHHLKLAGTADLIGVFDDKLSIIDFKTSLKPKRKEWCEGYFCQEAGYAIMWEERTAACGNRMPITQLVTIIVNEENLNMEPQVFIEHRDTWAPKLIETRKIWEQRNG